MFDALLGPAAQEHREKEPSTHSMGKIHKYILSPFPSENQGQDQAPKTIDSNKDMPIDAAFLSMMDDPSVSVHLRNDVRSPCQWQSRSKPRADCHSRHPDFVVYCCHFIGPYLLLEVIACQVFQSSLLCDWRLPGLREQVPGAFVSFLRPGELIVQAIIIADGITIWLVLEAARFDM